MVVLLDTGFILALRNKDDNNHTKARLSVQCFESPRVISEGETREVIMGY